MDDDRQLRWRQQEEIRERQAYEEAEYDDMIERESKMEFETCFIFSTKCGVVATDKYLSRWINWFEKIGVPAAIVRAGDHEPYKFHIWRTGERRYQTEAGKNSLKPDTFRGRIIEECHDFSAKVGATLVGGDDAAILE